MEEQEPVINSSHKISILSTIKKVILILGWTLKLDLIFRENLIKQN